MKSEMVVVESLEISNLYIKNKEIMNGLICKYAVNILEMCYINARILIANFRSSRLYSDGYRPNIPSVLLTIMMLT